jgi:hypothetical protein
MSLRAALASEALEFFPARSRNRIGVGERGAAAQKVLREFVLER